MVDIDSGSGSSAPRKRADARRNEETLLDAAAAAFVASGVDVPVRDIAAGPASAWARSTVTSRRGPISSSPSTGTRSRRAPRPVRPCWRTAAHRTPPWRSWINLFVDFLVTKHGLAEALQSDNAAFETLHAYFLDRLVPVCAQLLDAAAAAGEIRPDMDAYELMRGVGNLCIGADNNPRYDARRMVGLLIAGLRLH